MFKLHAAIPLSELAHLVQEQKGVKERGIYTRFSHGTDYHSIVKGRGDAPRLVLQCLCFIL